MVAGTSNNQPRMEALPLRMPLPSSTGEGSIYVRQQDMSARYFDTSDIKANGGKVIEAAQ